MTPSLVKGKLRIRINRQRTEFIFFYSIPIHERVELPDELIPADSRVEIDAKITAGQSPMIAMDLEVVA